MPTNIADVLATLEKVNQIVAGLNTMGVKVTGTIDLPVLLKLLNINPSA